MSEKKELKQEQLNKVNGGQVIPNTHTPKSNNTLPVCICIHCSEQVDIEYAREDNYICPKCNKNMLG